MKVLILGVMKDNTGYAHAAMDTAMSCAAAGLDVVTRSISFNNNKTSCVFDRIHQFESKDLQNVDAIIQYCLPHTYEYKGGVKNIGYFAYETDNFLLSGWHKFCNIMDEIWTMCPLQKIACENSNVITPSYVIPNGCDISKYDKDYADIGINARGSCVFYTIAENNRRKNIVNLIRSYYMAFSAKDNVCLLIKTNKSQPSLGDIISEMKTILNMHGDVSMYPRILLIDTDMTDDQIGSLHKSCDIFVTMSRGESWCIPAVDAMGFGNPIIAPNWGSFPYIMLDSSHALLDRKNETYIHSDDVQCGWLVGGHTIPCVWSEKHPFNIYTGRELWFDPNICDMAKHMKTAYVMHQENTLSEKKKYARQRVEKFSYKNVGEIIKERLNS